MKKKNFDPNEQVKLITKDGKEMYLPMSYFNGRLPKDWDVVHIDGNKENNRLDNLELVRVA